MSQNSLDELFDKYKGQIIVESIDEEDLVDLTLRLPREMVTEYMEIMNHEKRNPVSFWKKMNFKERLKTIPESQIENTYGILNMADFKEALDYLVNVEISFQEYTNQPDKIRLNVNEN